MLCVVAGNTFSDGHGVIKEKRGEGDRRKKEVMR